MLCDKHKLAEVLPLHRRSIVDTFAFLLLRVCSGLVSISSFNLASDIGVGSFCVTRRRSERSVLLNVRLEAGIAAGYSWVKLQLAAGAAVVVAERHRMADEAEREKERELRLSLNHPRAEPSTHSVRMRDTGPATREA